MIDKFQVPTGLKELGFKGVKHRATLDELRKRLLKENGKFYTDLSSPAVTFDVNKDARYCVTGPY